MSRLNQTDQALWTPSANWVQQSNMSRFIRYVQNHDNPDICDYPNLYQFSLQQPEKFWAAVWEFCGIRSSKGWQKVVDATQPMPGANWFEGARLNFAQNLLRHKTDETAIFFRGEAGHSMQMSFKQLFDKTEQLAAAMRKMGIQAGDRVAAYMPNLPHTVIAMLATASIGAIWSSCSPDFGVKGAVDRFQQIEPKLLFTADGYIYGGKSYSTLDKADEIRSQIASVEKLIVVPYLQRKPEIAQMQNTELFNRFLIKDAPALTFEQLPFDHPLYILFSSGTTGAPKCIVHSAGGTLIQHLKELVLHTNLKPQDRLFYFTTCGWMMWNWMVSALAVGASIVLYDGSPAYPGPEKLFSILDELNIQIFGTSAKWLSAVEKHPYSPNTHHQLKNLRCILSTGSPLLPDQFDYVYQHIKSDIHLASISGGTDIVSCFALGNPIQPVWKGELQGPGLGMKVEILDETGQPTTHQAGELCCTQSFPSMPIGFWGDEKGERYQQAYFSQFSGIWSQGDRASMTEHNGLIIFGRSDATLNPGGVRIGTAEIYRIVEQFDLVKEALAIGQDWADDIRIILFVSLIDDQVLEEDLIQQIRQAIRKQASPRHVPAMILQAPAFPKTRSGKMVEMAVRDIIHGQQPNNTEALSNPESLDFFRHIEALFHE